MRLWVFVANPLRLPVRLRKKTGLPPANVARRIRFAVLIPRLHAPVVTLLRAEGWTVIGNIYRSVGLHPAAVPHVGLGCCHRRLAVNRDLIGCLFRPPSAILQSPRKSGFFRIDPEWVRQRFTTQSRWLRGLHVGSLSICRYCNDESKAQIKTRGFLS